MPTQNGSSIDVTEDVNSYALQVDAYMTETLPPSQRTFDKSLRLENNCFVFAGNPNTETRLKQTNHQEKHSASRLLIGQMNQFHQTLSDGFSTSRRHQLVFQSAVNLESCMLQDKNLTRHAHRYTEILKADQILAKLMQVLPEGDRLMCSWLETQKETIEKSIQIQSHPEETLSNSVTTKDDFAGYDKS